MLRNDGTVGAKKGKLSIVIGKTMIS